MLSDSTTKQLFCQRNLARCISTLVKTRLNVMWKFAFGIQSVGAQISLYGTSRTTETSLSCWSFRLAQNSHKFLLALLQNVGQWHSPLHPSRRRSLLWTPVTPPVFQHRKTAHIDNIEVRVQTLFVNNVNMQVTNVSC